MSEIVQVIQQAYEQFKQNNTITKLDFDENLEKTTKSYTAFFKECGILNYVKHLQGDSKTNDQLILYESIDKMYEVKRMLYQYSYEEISAIFDNPPPQVKEYLYKCFQEYYKMEQSSLSPHGIKPLKFNIVSAPQKDFNFLYCEFIFEHFPHSLGNILSNDTSISTEHINKSLSSLDYFIQILEGIIFLEENYIRANFDLTHDVVVDDPSKTLKLVRIKNINKEFDKVLAEPLYSFPNIEIAKSFIEFKGNENLTISVEEKEFSDLIHKLAVLILKFFEVYKELNLNDSDFIDIQKSKTKFQNFQDIMQKKINSLTQSLDKNLLEMIKEIIETPVINLGKAREIFDSLQNFNKQYNHFREPDEFLNLGKEDVLNDKSEPQNNFLDQNREVQTSELDSLKMRNQQLEVSLNKLENELILKKQESELLRNKNFELEKKIQQKQDLNNLNANTKITDLQNIKKTLEMEIEEKNKECQELRNSFNKKSVEIIEIQAQHGKSIGKPNVGNVGNFAKSPFVKDEMQDKFNENKLQEKEKEINQLKDLIKEEKRQFQTLNSNYQQIKNELALFKNKYQELEEKYNKEMFNQEINKDSPIPYIHTASQPVNEETLNNKYILACQQVDVIKAQIQKLKEENKKDSSQESSIHSIPTKAGVIQPNSQVNQLNQELSDQRANEQDLTCMLETCQRDLGKVKKEYEQYKASHQGKNSSNEAQFEIFLLQIAKSSIKHSTTNISSGVEFTLNLDEYKNLINSINAQEIEKPFIEKKYNGMMSNGKPHGFGRMDYPDGSLYKGSFANGYREGTGILINKTKKTKYYGSFLNNCYHGFGIFIDESIPNQPIIYNGQFVNDKMHGEGTLIFDNLDIYVGGIYEGKIHGSGIKYFRGGAFYKGNFKDEKINGYGILTYSNKSSYEGFWINDKMHGQGKFFNAEQNSTCEGEFKEGAIFNGKLTCIKDSKITIEYYNLGKKVSGSQPPPIPQQFTNLNYNHNSPSVPLGNNPNARSSPNLLVPPIKNQKVDSSQTSNITYVKASTKKYN